MFFAGLWIPIPVMPDVLADIDCGHNIVSTVAPWFMLSFAYKVQGESKTHFHCLADYPAYNKDRKNDKALVTDLHRLVFSDADVLVGHNIDRFDGRKLLLVRRESSPRPQQGGQRSCDPRVRWPCMGSYIIRCSQEAL